LKRHWSIVRCPGRTCGGGFDSEVNRGPRDLFDTIRVARQSVMLGSQRLGCVCNASSWAGRRRRRGHPHSHFCPAAVQVIRRWRPHSAAAAAEVYLHSRLLKRTVLVPRSNADLGPVSLNTFFPIMARRFAPRNAVGASTQQHPYFRMAQAFLH
jgi:hypothetical protein